MGLLNVFKKPAVPLRDDPRVLRQQANEEFYRQRLNDPMLDYWNKDVRWSYCTTNMGPGGEWFTGVEIHAVWNRPEEPLPIAEQTMLTTTNPVKYPRFDYRIVAIGLLPAAARALVRLRNAEVLG